jgi:hypothetical protein
MARSERVATRSLVQSALPRAEPGTSSQTVRERGVTAVRRMVNPPHSDNCRAADLVSALVGNNGKRNVSAFRKK